jgi:hypothetical protein
MSRTIIILEDSPDSLRLGKAMLQGIAQAEAKSDAVVATFAEIVTVTELAQLGAVDAIYCPLTLSLPPEFEFWGRDIFRSCVDIEALRHLAATRTGTKVGDRGNLWLPVVWTARGPMYGEVIGEVDADRYRQPIHFNDVDRQPLYQFGYQLLSQLNTPPATYLVQFSHQEREVIFDRLWPFPALPALASIDIQSPDLFACHWRCITRQPMIDIRVGSWELGVGRACL